VHISTDKSSYNIGDSITVCYTISYSAPIVILDHQTDGTTQTLLSGVDDGNGDCSSNLVVTGPPGTETMEIDMLDPSGSSVIADDSVSFTVSDGTGRNPPPAETPVTVYVGGDADAGICFTAPPGRVVISGPDDDDQGTRTYVTLIDDDDYANGTCWYDAWWPTNPAIPGTLHLDYYKPGSSTVDATAETNY
jgi:hypothetical protein